MRILKKRKQGWSKLGYKYSDTSTSTEIPDSERQVARVPNTGGGTGWSKLGYKIQTPEPPAPSRTITKTTIEGEGVATSAPPTGALQSLCKKLARVAKSIGIKS